MYKSRKSLYEKLADARNSQVLTYITGDRNNLYTQIASDAVVYIGDLLDHYEGADRISLYLYTRGGETLAAWSIVNLLREFCDYLEIIIPSKCHSAGTLICLGADNIVMTKQATLGPIDPTVNTAINPGVPGHPETVRNPVSVEEAAGFLEMARTEAGMKAEQSMTAAYLKLADHVHPLVLGKVSRTRSQIQDLASKLLSMHMEDKDKISKIVDVLCTKAGSHDYTINRTEARRDLGLSIESPTMDLYKIIRSIYQDIRKELELESPFNPGQGLTNVGDSKGYDVTRATIESQKNGGFFFRKRGAHHKKQLPNGAIVVEDTVAFEGWEFKK